MIGLIATEDTGENNGRKRQQLMFFLLNGSSKISTLCSLSVFSKNIMKKIAHFQKSPFVTTQDVVHVLVLILLSLLFCLVPTVGLGQTVSGTDPFSSLDFAPPPAMSAPSELAPASFTQATSEVPTVSASVSPMREQVYSSPPLEMPTPTAASASPVTASHFQPIQTPSYQQPLLRSPQDEAVVNAEHPFRQYWGVPNDPQTKITGKPMTVAELFAGTRSPSVRCQLLQAYWELSGLLAVYHFRCETERLASRAAGSQQEGMITLLSEQRRTAEIEFIKQQWVLAELMKQCKGQALRESELPIPADYPLYPRYQTFADKIARTERTQYLGRMIPIQEQLIESKNGTWRAASEMAQSASQPFFMVSNQRTMTFLDLTKAIIEYNKMIAEYALDTIPSNVNQRQLVGAVVRLPKGNTIPEQPQSQQIATGGIKLTQYEMPTGIAAQSVERIAREFSAAPASVMAPENE